MMPPLNWQQPLSENWMVAQRTSCVNGKTPGQHETLPAMVSNYLAELRNRARDGALKFFFNLI